jgi:hypothetical protein
MKHLITPLGLAALVSLLAQFTPASAQPVTNGLAVYLNFDNNILAQGGTTHSGTAIGADPTPKYTTGIIGGAGIFDNDGSGTTPGDWAVSLGDIESLYAGTWSFTTWINATNNNDGALLGNKDWTSGADIGWLVDPSRSSFLNYRCAGGARHDVGGANLLDGKWQHVAAVFDRGSNVVTSYVDGARKSTSPLAVTGTESLTPTTFSPNDTLIGGSGNGLYSGAGAIDDLGIWTRALSDADVLAIYAQGVKGQPLTTAVAGTLVKPTLSGQPQGATIFAGFPINLSVTASGTTPLSYQWYLNSKQILGATNSGYAVRKVSTNDMGSYIVVVSNAAGSATSAPPAVLTVVPAASKITDHLAVYLNFDSNITAQAGTTNSATAIGDVGVPKYTNGVISGAALFENDQGSGPSASDWAASLGNVEWIYTNNWTFSLWVKTKDTLGAMIGNKDWSSGGNIGWLISEFYANFLNYRAVDSSRYDIGNFNWADGKWHHVAAVFYRDLNTVYTFVDGKQTASAPLSNTGFDSLTPADIVPNATLIGSSGSASYSGAGTLDDLGIWTRPLNGDELLSIYAQGLNGQPLTTALTSAAILPKISVGPQSETRIQGLPVSFSVTATGSSPLLYQWYRNTNSLTGQTNATLTFTAASQISGTAYSVVVKNAFGSATSSPPAVLTVIPGATSITDGLVVHLNFESNLVAAAGTSISATAIGNVGVPVYTNGIIGHYAALFQNDGGGGTAASDWAASLGDIEWIYTNNWSFSLWVKTTDTLGAVLGNKDWTSGGNIGWLISQYYTNFLNYRAIGAARHDIGSFPWADNKWHQVAAVFYRDANAVYTFVDGRITDQASLGDTGYESLTPTDITPNATLVGSSGNAAYSASATVDDLGLWTRPLTPDEINGIYQSGLAGNDLTQPPPAGAPSLAAALSGHNIVLTYPGTAQSYTLTSASNLVSSSWLPVATPPSVVGTNLVVTLPISPGNQFFRLQRSAGM